MSSGASTSRRSHTIFCGLTGKPVVLGVARRGRSTIAARMRLNGDARLRLGLAPRCRAAASPISPSTPTATM